MVCTVVLCWTLCVAISRQTSAASWRVWRGWYSSSTATQGMECSCKFILHTVTSKHSYKCLFLLKVVTTCSTDAEPLLESLGADVVIDYTKPDSEKQIKEEGPLVYFY
jgi:hypothetical protein